MSALNIQQVFSVEIDGVVRNFNSRAEALEALQKPLQMKAFNALTSDPELSEWLIESKEDIVGVFESSKIRRVSKSEKARLVKALEIAVERLADVPAAKFLIENAEQIAESFRWPSVKRGTPEEQAERHLAQLDAITEGNAELSAWILENKDAILEAYNAGKPKREVSPAAAAGLARWRAEQAALAARAAEGADEAEEVEAEEADEVDEADYDEQEEQDEDMEEPVRKPARKSSKK